MKNYKSLNLLVLILCLVACGKSDKKKANEQIIDPVFERELEITQNESVSIHRLEQMVSRYNCQNELISRKLETQNSLSKKITIDYSNRKKAWSYSVYNCRTKSSNRGAFTNEGKFVVDYAPTVFNMYVREGVNDVEYTFYKCPKIELNDQNQKVCAEKLEIEKEGIVQLDIHYTSETLPGELHVYPEADSCQI